ncbi:FkbM family methyltransferase [Candidatus Pelagibacter sp.]|nr:FkbM family methyltransferase [Candidatus Pelagibacter sp.]
MKSGSSIFEEQTIHPRELEILKSTTLSSHITPSIINSYNNLIKIDAQSSEIKILKGLGQFINHFEIIILEVSLHKYNKDAPLFDEVMNFMNDKDFCLYDIYDLKRLGNNNSFLLQFDCIFIRKNSNLLKVKF